MISTVNRDVCLYNIQYKSLRSSFGSHALTFPPQPSPLRPFTFEAKPNIAPALLSP